MSKEAKKHDKELSTQEDTQQKALNPTSQDLYFLPVGGSQQIGMNANLYGHNGTWILIDCGVEFKGISADRKSLEVYVPDLYSVKEIINKVEAIFITHGHEDHIAALQFFCNKANECDLSKATIYTTKFTSALIKKRFPSCSNFQFSIIQPNDEIKVGDITVKAIHTTHSIPSTLSLFIRTPIGNVFHTGDWKFDDNPFLGQKPDYDSIKECAKEGIMAVIGDSTNVCEDKEKVSSEISLRDSLKGIMENAKGRVFVTCFSSHVGRVMLLMDIAKEIGRTPLILGRSLGTLLEVSKESGIIPKDLQYKDALSHFYMYNPQDVVIICTGTQSEPGAALDKIANDKFEEVKLSKGDTVIFSSRIIPGNEKMVYAMCHKLHRKGADIILPGDANVHTGGHPDKMNIRLLLETLKPELLIPVHGEFMHIMKHKKFAKSLNIEKVHVPYNGEVFNIPSNEIIHTFNNNKLINSGGKLIYADDEIFLQKGELFEKGVISILININHKGLAKHPPIVRFSGVHDAIDYRDDLVNKIFRTFSKKQNDHDNGTVTVDSVMRKIRGILNSFYSAKYMKSPRSHIFVNFLK